MQCIISRFRYKIVDMKMLRKNIDLDSKTVAILQIEASLAGYGTLKPYLEYLLDEKAKRSVKDRPSVYKSLMGVKKPGAVKRGKSSSLRRGSSPKVE